MILSPPPLPTTTYNNISRLVLKLPTCISQIDKQEISANIRAMDNEKSQALLLSKLIAIKYYRQTGIFNRVEDVDKQNQYWQEIADQGLLPPNTSLPKLMAYIKNDGFIVQKKIPSEFKDLLLCSDDAKKKILDIFSKKDRSNMRDFLADATGENWTFIDRTAELAEAQKKFKADFHNAFITSSNELKDQRWIEVLKLPVNFFAILDRSTKDTKKTIATFNNLVFDDYVSQTNTYGSLYSSPKHQGSATRGFFHALENSKGFFIFDSASKAFEKALSSGQES